ncbi:glycosyltransferase family 2 protein [Vibrio astriarenae]
MSHVFISIVSHGNDNDIVNNSNMLAINGCDNATVIVRDNLSSEKLKSFCAKESIIYNASENTLGFGANNNINFDLALDLGMKDDDWFVIFNPDLDISLSMFDKLYSRINYSHNNFFAINLYFDDCFENMEQSLRKYPSISSFFNIFRGGGFTEPYNKSLLSDGDYVDWAAGSFLVFKSSLYKSLNGFDESYFMYFEDVDICFRANKLMGEPVVYLNDIKAVHQGGYKNRNVFSKHFRWYLVSLVKFLFKSKFRIMK